MLRITLIINGKYLLFDWAQHASVIITDLVNNETYFVSNIPKGINKTNAPLYSIIPDSQRMEETCDRSIVTLFCTDHNKSLADFKSAYEKNFSNKHFNFFTNNCSDAANFAIDYFFPDARKLDELCSIYNSLSSLFYFGTIGAGCFPPSCISTPSKTFREVKRLEKYYGRVNIEEAISQPSTAFIL